MWSVVGPAAMAEWIRWTLRMRCQRLLSSSQEGEGAVYGPRLEVPSRLFSGWRRPTAEADSVLSVEELTYCYPEALARLEAGSEAGNPRLVAC